MLNTIETIGLKVECTSPREYSTNVDINSVIEISFNSDLNVKTIAGSVHILRDKDRLMYGKPTSININDFEKVEGSLSYKEENRTVIFRPLNQLQTASRYIIYIPKNSISDFKGRVSLANYIATFDTDGFATLPPCKVVYPSDNSVIASLDRIEVEGIGSEKYIVQISRNSDFENGVYDEVVSSNIINSNLDIGDGSYYIRAKGTNGIFGETSFFTIKSLPESLVSDEDEYFKYEPIDDIPTVELVDSFPIGINVHEKTNLIYMKFEGLIDINDIDFYESGLYEKSLLEGDEFSPDSVDGTFSVIQDLNDEVTYVAFIPESL